MSLPDIDIEYQTISITTPAICRVQSMPTTTEIITITPADILRKYNRNQLTPLQRAHTINPPHTTSLAKGHTNQKTITIPPTLQKKMTDWIDQNLTIGIRAKPTNKPPKNNPRKLPGRPKKKNTPATAPEHPWVHCQPSSFHPEWIPLPPNGPTIWESPSRGLNIRVPTHLPHHPTT